MNELAANLQQYLSASSLLAYPAAFVAGVLISFTPCVYPIIPIQLGYRRSDGAASGGRAAGPHARADALVAVRDRNGRGLCRTRGVCVVDGDLVRRVGVEPLGLSLRRQRRAADGTFDARRFSAPNAAVSGAMESESEGERLSRGGAHWRVVGLVVGPCTAPRSVPLWHTWVGAAASSSARPCCSCSRWEWVRS